MAALEIVVAQERVQRCAAHKLDEPIVREGYFAAKEIAQKGAWLARFANTVMETQAYKLRSIAVRYNCIAETS